MESAFAWIGQLMEWLGNWIPHYVIVKSTHGGVKFVRGHKVVEMPPGWHLYWPLTTEILLFPVARQTHNLPVQVMMTKDGKQVVVSGVVVYTIESIVDALAKNWDIDDTINDIAQMAVIGVVTSWPLWDLQQKISAEVEHELTKITRRQLKQYGVHVHRCGLTDFSQARVTRTINDPYTVIDRGSKNG